MKNDILDSYLHCDRNRKQNNLSKDLTARNGKRLTRSNLTYTEKVLFGVPLLKQEAI